MAGTLTATKDSAKNYMVKPTISATRPWSPPRNGWDGLGRRVSLADETPRGIHRVEISRRLTPAEALYYCVILTLPFEETFTIAEGSVTKGVGLLFLFFSIIEWRTFYAKVPRALVALLGFIGIGLGVDLATCARVNFSALNQFTRPILVWWLMLMTYNLALRNRFDRIVRIMFAASLLYAIFQSLSLGGPYLWVDEGAIGGEDGARVAVLGSDPNFAATFLAVGALFGLVLGLNISKTHLGFRILFLLGAGIGFYAILKTGSRGGLLALGGGVLSLAFTSRHWIKKTTSMLLVACVILAMGVLVAQNSYLAGRFRSSAETGDTAGRFEIWKQAVRLAVESPLYGFGNSMYYFKLGQKMGSVARGTHNLFLSVLLGAGFTGALFFLYFYVRAFKAIWSCRKQEMGRIVFAWFVLATLAGMSLNMEIAKWFWVVLALSLAAEKVYSRKRARVAGGGGGPSQALLYPTSRPNGVQSLA